MLQPIHGIVPSAVAARIITPSICHAANTGGSVPCLLSELKRQLGRLIGFNFFHGSPLEADSEDPPDYMVHNELQAGYWRRAWTLRCELERKQ